MLTRESIENLIKETDSRIPVPAIKKQAVACTVCKPNLWFKRMPLGIVAYMEHFQKKHIKRKVFILYHTDQYDSVGCDCGNDIGIDQPIIQGIFTTRALAEQAKKKIKSKIPYEEKEFEIKSVIMDTRL